VNTNCLEGWKCSRCGHEDSFHVAAVIHATVYLTDDGVVDQDDHDTEWNDDGWAKCCGCGHMATVGFFTSGRTVLDEIAEV
jgi:hypothetical protein